MYVVQNIINGKYIKHNGSTELEDYPYDYVDSPEKAEHYSTFEHAEYVAFWYADMSQSWRIVNLETSDAYVKSGHRVGKVY